MTEPSSGTLAIFLAVVVVVFGLYLAMVMRSLGTSGSRVAAIVLGLVAWIGIPGALASAGLLDRYAPLPAPPLILTGALTVGTIVLAMRGFGTRVLTAVPLWLLVGYQVFRIPVEWCLHRLYLEGTVPVVMTFSGRNFDIVSGLTAGVVALILRTRRAPRLALAWNVVGMALLANIVVIAVLATPTPFRRFTDGPANLLPSTFPYLWLPTFLVQAALFGHLVVFRALARRSSETS